MRIALSITAGLLLTACSSPSTPPPAATPRPQAAASTQRVKTPWDNLLKDENKARAVQQKVDAHAKRLQQAIEKQSQ